MPEVQIPASLGHSCYLAVSDRCLVGHLCVFGVGARCQRVHLQVRVVTVYITYTVAWQATVCCAIFVMYMCYIQEQHQQTMHKIRVAVCCHGVSVHASVFAFASVIKIQQIR